MKEKGIELDIGTEMIRDRRNRVVIDRVELRKSELENDGTATVENEDNEWDKEEVKEIGDREVYDGYSIARELVTYLKKDGSVAEQFQMKSAFADSGCYLGDREIAKLIVVKLGIVPESRTGKQKGEVCNIGFCEKEQNWYGWSHRARGGFGIGSKVTIGDVAYLPGVESDVPEDEHADWILAGKPLGRGEWEAKTLEDAKEMACDYAKSIA
ncbi:MAG: hypothetical protein BA863_04930 [Desulfovibrio sp. S3730MH75]|nr:MAG: hypothetical protein BA863_04930 [Desulfovibrio sp. S3730MH75]